MSESTTGSIQNRCCGPDCVILGATLTKLVNNIAGSYYNNGTDVKVDGGTAAGAPNPNAIPTGMTIKIGTKTLKNRSASGAISGINAPLTDSSLHYEFVEMLKITETENTVTLFYPGKIIIDADIDVSAGNKDLLIMSACGHGGILVKKSLKARNITLTAMGGHIEVGGDITTVSGGHIAMFSDTLNIAAGKIVKADVNGGVTTIITNTIPTGNSPQGNHVIRSGTTKFLVKYDKDNNSSAYEVSYDKAVCSAKSIAGDLTRSSSTALNLANYVDFNYHTGDANSTYFVNGANTIILVHSGNVTLPNLSGSNWIGKNIFVVTPCDITATNIQTHNNQPNETGKNVTLIAGGTITVNGRMDLTPSSSLGTTGGICTLIGRNIGVQGIDVANNVFNSGRLFIAAAENFSSGQIGANNSTGSSDGDVLTLSTGGSIIGLSLWSFSALSTEDNLPSTINMLAGVSITDDITQTTSSTGAGGNILVSCGSDFDMNNIDSISGVYSQSSNGPAGNIFVLAGLGILANAVGVYGTVTGGRVVFTSGYDISIKNPINVSGTISGLATLTYGNSSNQGGTKNSNLWISTTPSCAAVTNAKATFDCGTNVVTLSATVAGATSSSWSLILKPIGSTAVLTGIIFKPDLPGTYAAQITAFCGNCIDSKTVSISFVQGECKLCVIDCPS